MRGYSKYDIRLAGAVSNWSKAFSLGNPLLVFLNGWVFTSSICLGSVYCIPMSCLEVLAVNTHPSIENKSKIVPDTIILS